MLEYRHEGLHSPLVRLGHLHVNSVFTVPSRPRDLTGKADETTLESSLRHLSVAPAFGSALFLSVCRDKVVLLYCVLLPPRWVMSRINIGIQTKSDV